MSFTDWFFRGTGSWSDRASQQKVDRRRANRARRIRAANQLRDAKAARRKRGFLYWE